MNTITIPKNKYLQILETQEKLRGDVNRLQIIVSSLTQDEVSPEYLASLSKIERGLSAGKGIAFKNKTEIKKFFKVLS